MCRFSWNQNFLSLSHPPKNKVAIFRNKNHIALQFQKITFLRNFDYFRIVCFPHVDDAIFGPQILVLKSSFSFICFRKETSVDPTEVFVNEDILFAKFKLSIFFTLFGDFTPPKSRRSSQTHTEIAGLYQNIQIKSIGIALRPTLL